MMKNIYCYQDPGPAPLSCSFLNTRSAKALLLALVFVLQAFSILAQTKQNVSGRITSGTDNSALPGVSILIKGTTQGVTSDASGHFSLQAAASDVLVISYIGFISQEVTVGNRTNISVVLKEDQKVLNEVVVTGYGELRRTEITGAQTSISAKEIEKTINTTVEQAIQGRSPGVYVTQNSGQPGGGISVNIRGISSINGNTEPLYVVDGVQIEGRGPSFGATSSSNPLAAINPSDIESMEILQGPSATAVFGSRGTNGVVLITTKRGKSGEVKINYGYLYSLQTAPERFGVMNLRQYAQMENEFKAIAGGAVRQEFLDPSILGEGTDWQKELFKSAPMSKHQLSLSGGSDNTTYRLSTEYLKQDGIAIGSGFNRYNVRLNMDSKARKWLTLAANLSVSQTDEKLSTSQENIIPRALTLPPHIPVRNLDGSWGGGNKENNSAEQFTPPNPIALANITTNDLKRRQVLGGFKVVVSPIQGLNLVSSLNGNVDFGANTYFVPNYRFGSMVNPTSSLSTGNTTGTYWNWNNMAEYKREFGKHRLNLMASHEAQAGSWKNVSAGRTGFVTNDLIDLNLGTASTATNGGGNNDWAIRSYLGRVNYSFADRYIATVSFRMDGSSRFGADNRWAYFPAVSAAWRVSEEPFFKIDFIQDLRLRYEIGSTGNQNGSGVYGSLGAANSAWGTGFLANRYANPGLKWEDTRTNNFGLTLSVLENKVQIEADYYNKGTNNLLLSNPLPWYMGTNGSGSIAPPMVNIGSLENKGWNVNLKTVNIDKGDLYWESSLNFSQVKTRIKEFYSESAFVDRISWWMNDWTQRASVGQTPWLFRGYIEEGIFQSVEEIQNSALPVDNNGNELPIAENSIWVGDIKYKDVNGDGKINFLDQTNIGNPFPKFFAGFTNAVSYKGFDLNVFVTGTFGNDIYNYMRFQNTKPNNINVGQNLMIETLDYAKVAYPADDPLRQRPYLLNPGTRIPRMAAQDANGNFNKHTSKFVEDGSFVRLKNVTLNYNIPSAIMARQKLVRGARVGISAQNLFTWTKYSGYDPEVGSSVGRDVSATNQAIGLDYGRYPLTPVYSFNVGIDL
ncbi:MAG: SusC/RagA family TonB-linked outer membrane protein [Adhaeribacter sp.]